jgi:5,10-methylenetetrahydrofolate reductase
VTADAGLLAALRSDDIVLAAELRPPRAELAAGASMDAWIDTYHAVRSLSRQGTYVLITDSAVGTREEDNLRHLVANIGRDVPRDHIVPFLTCKHPLDFCLAYAERAWAHGFPALVVLGGDTRVGPPRCVQHAWELRHAIRARHPDLALGGWANPGADPARQVQFLIDDQATADFFLTQIVSHYRIRQVEHFVEEADRRGLELPGVFGVFFYRSASPKTLSILQQFLPVPAEDLTRDFAAGLTPEDICARSLRALMDAGIRRFYISNLPLTHAGVTLQAILDRVGVSTR